MNGSSKTHCGTVRRRWRPCVQNKTSEVELVLQANYVEVSNAHKSEVVSAASDIKDCFNEYWSKYQACPLKGRDHILASVCPQVYGLHLVKLAVLLTVISGSNHTVAKEESKAQDEKHETHVREQCHLLLVGDPGTGKSQLLRAAAELTARSVFTSGTGSTKAGLTCAAFREDGEWQLEAGALVLSDGGVCCIDEISHLREHDRTAIHEAMEQQTISIAKAGIVCKLNTRCAVIAACNPKGQYQTDEPLSANVSLGTPLLSRFDLIFIMIDSKDKAWDKLVSSYILFGNCTNESKKKWSLEKLQMYISLVGSKGVQMTKSANTILQAYYMMQRKSQCRDPSRTTVRMLDSLVRLSQAHCRLMYRTTILPMDAIIAVSLVDLSMQDCTLDDTVNALHSIFTKHLDYEYLCTAKKVLNTLNLYSIWQEELLYYGKLLQVDDETLKSEIDKGSCYIFSKCGDVIDDNIHLSASLVTSSYFKVNKQKNIEIKDDSSIDKENKIVNYRLVATLKKHATLNKDERKPPIVSKRKNVIKRKKKTITHESNSLGNKKICSKRRKKQNSESSHLYMPDNIPDYAKLDERNIALNTTSSNESCSELEISDENEKKYSERITVNNTNSTNLNLDNHGAENSKECDKNVDETLTVCKEVNKLKPSLLSKTMEKLNQFQCPGKCDLRKFYDEKSTIPKQQNISVLNDNQVSSSNCISETQDHTSSSQKPSCGSQISMFESSDCEIDLDI